MTEEQNNPQIEANPKPSPAATLSYIVPTSEKSFRLIYDNAIIEFSLK